MKKRAIVSAAMTILLAIGLAGPALGAQAAILTKIKRVMITSNEQFGGCMASLVVSPDSMLQTCGAGWVSFSCTGDAMDPVRAYRMVDQAQLALARGSNVRVVFTDDQKHNGYCVVRQIQIMR